MSPATSTSRRPHAGSLRRRPAGLPARHRRPPGRRRAQRHGRTGRPTGPPGGLSLDTTDGVTPARIASPASSPLLGGIPIEEQVRRAVEQSPAPRPTEPSFRSPSQATVAGAAGRPAGQRSGRRHGLPTRTPRSYDEVERNRSARCAHPSRPYPRPTLRSTRRCGRPGSAGVGGRSTGPARLTRAGAERRPRCAPPRRPRARRTHREEVERAQVTRPEPSPTHRRSPSRWSRSPRTAPPACRCGDGAPRWCRVRSRRWSATPGHPARRRREGRHQGGLHPGQPAARRESRPRETGGWYPTTR